MDTITVELLVGLCAVGACAGLVDAIAGGGGLLTLPALLWAGLPPVDALATNKAQGVFGSFTASVHFVRREVVDLRRMVFAILCTFVGGACGAAAVQRLDAQLLEPLVPLLLIGFALYFWLAPGVGTVDGARRVRDSTFAVLIGTGVGFYDGFFGPGTGTFFAAAFVLLLGHNLIRATAGTKVLNFTSNFASLLVFAAAGKVLWPVGIAMGVAQIAGAWIGARLVTRFGSSLVRPLLVSVSMVISISLLLRHWR